jgi:hypothetical protein
LALTLVILAAGIASRYGRLKQLEPVGPVGEALMDYGVFDAVRAGFTKVVFVVRPEIEQLIREHVENLVGDSIAIAFMHQTLGAVPSGATAWTDRTKPWGTAHALLTAADEVGQVFAVSNADDFYGRMAYETLGEHLSGVETSPQPAYSLVGYTLQYTLSPFGGVSRALCRFDDNGFLTQLVEVHDIAQGKQGIVGTTEDGTEVELEGSETVSMNLWGLTTDVFPALQRQFERFLSEDQADREAEFLIPSALSEQLLQRQIRIRVLRAEDDWMGMTFREDRPNVAARIQDLVNRGQYPYDLAAWFSNQS